MANLRLLESAADWTGQTYEQRLTMAAELLYTHGYLTPTTYRRIDRRLAADAIAARADRMQVGKPGRGGVL